MSRPMLSTTSLRRWFPLDSKAIPQYNRAAVFAYSLQSSCSRAREGPALRTPLAAAWRQEWNTATSSMRPLSVPQLPLHLEPLYTGQLDTSWCQALRRGNMTQLPARRNGAAPVGGSAANRRSRASSPAALQLHILSTIELGRKQRSWALRRREVGGAFGVDR